MLHKFGILLVLGPVLLVIACDELFIDEKEAHFEIFYYHPQQEKPMNLGIVKGLQTCRNVVRSRANAVGKARYKDDYVCCLITKKSSCAKRMK